MNKRLSGIVYASLAALFYAISIPCSKAMLSSASPTMTSIKEKRYSLYNSHGGA